GADPGAVAILGALSAGEPSLRRGGPGGDLGYDGGGVGPGLPSRACTHVPPRSAAGPEPRPLLAHPLAAVRDLPRHAAGQGTPAGVAGERPDGIPAPVLRRALPALRRGAPRSGGGLGDRRSDVRRAHLSGASVP